MKRYNQDFADMELADDGEWIRYEDHVEAMKRIAGDGGQAEPVAWLIEEGAEKHWYYTPQPKGRPVYFDQPQSAPVAQGLTRDEIVSAYKDAYAHWMNSGGDLTALIADRILAQAAPSASAQLAQGCTRSHPHENMSTECQQKTVEARAAFASAQQAEPVANNEAYDLAYDKIDRFLRSNLDDDDYAEFSRALDSLFAAPAPASPAAITWAEPRSLAESVAELRALEECDDRGLTPSEGESIGLVLRELARWQSLGASPAAPNPACSVFEDMLQTLEYTEAVYRLNVVKDSGEPSSTLENLQHVIARAKSASPAALTDRRCQQCNAPRKGDECHKCGAPTVEPCAGWEEPALPPIDRIRELAREVGYAVGVHGTQERDLDLIAAPWSEEAARLNYREVMQHIADGLGARLVEVEGKPLGRRACTIQMDGWYKPIDLSVCPMLAASPADQVDSKRLDYLDKYAVIAKQGQSVRDAIDQAMSASKEGA